MAAIESYKKVRSLLERSGGPSGVSQQDLAACRPDLLVVKRVHERCSEPGGILAGFFELSDEVVALIRRIADELEGPHAQRHQAHGHGHSASAAQPT